MNGYVAARLTTAWKNINALPVRHEVSCTRVSLRDCAVPAHEGDVVRLHHPADAVALEDAVHGFHLVDAPVAQLVVIQELLPVSLQANEIIPLGGDLVKMHEIKNAHHHGENDQSHDERHRPELQLPFDRRHPGTAESPHGRVHELLAVRAAGEKKLGHGGT